MNYSTKVSNKVERASNVLESNVRLNRITDNRGKRTGGRNTTKRETKRTGREGRANGAQRNRERNGTGENAGRERATQRTGRKRRTSDARRNGKRGGQNGGVERLARNETERRDGTGGRRLSSERGGREPLC